jgi:hypothetical protein
MCGRCGRRALELIGGLCIACGSLAGTTSPVHPAHHPAAVSVRARPDDHAEQPHPPEIEALGPPRREMTVQAPASFRLDDPVLGVLAGPGVARAGLA